MTRDLRAFLELFDERTHLALRRMSVLAVLLAATDFGIVLLLYPVLGSVLSSVADARHLGPHVVSALAPSTLLLLAMGLLMLRALGELATKAWWTRRVGEAEVRLGSRVLSAYAHAPYTFHLERNSADLLATGVAQVNMATSSGLNGLATIGADVASVVTVILALLVASPRAALVVCLGVGILVVLFVLVNRSIIGRQTSRYTQHVGRTYARASTVLKGIRELTVANARSSALEAIDRSRAEMVQAQQRLLLLGDVPRIALEIVLYLAMFGAAAVLLASDRIALATVGLFVVAALRILPAVGRALRTLTAMRAGIDLGSAIITELDDLERPRAPREVAGPACAAEAPLTLRDVSFAYDDRGPKVLDRVSVEIPFGNSLGVVGASGAGKSTLLAIVLGLLRPDEGCVTYGDFLVEEADPAWFRQVAYVPQDVFILDDSVSANVALGDPAPDELRIVEALRRAHLLDVVEGMDERLATRLGENGARMSIGQRQRLGIARALYRRAALLLLDEPTAALDADSEAHIVDTLQELRGQVTTILISHRSAPVVLADRVVRLESGRLWDVTTEHLEQGVMS